MKKHIAYHMLLTNPKFKIGHARMYAIIAEPAGWRAITYNEFDKRRITRGDIKHLLEDLHEAGLIKSRNAQGGLTEYITTDCLNSITDPECRLA